MLFTNRTFDLFDDMFNDPFFNRAPQATASQIMRTDVQERDNGYMLDIELPGYAKEDVQAELKDGYLTITAKKSQNKEEEDKNHKYVRKERYTGSCKRSFYVGDQLQQEDIKAAFQNGILRLFVPKESQKQVEDKPKLISIE
ncbi:MAG: Hsp20/alpha crystallin family protein [Eubacteriales bacterium]|nr:Hsp20/alpha crystallin family protein [Eubacteriales bacterium]